MPKNLASYVIGMVLDLPYALVLPKQLFHDERADALSPVGVGDKKSGDRPIEGFGRFRALIYERKTCKRAVCIDKIGKSFFIGEVVVEMRVVVEPRFVEGDQIVLRKFVQIFSIKLFKTSFCSGFTGSNRISMVIPSIIRWRKR